MIQRKITKEPYLQIWTPSMRQFIDDVPFGKPCNICFEILTEEEHQNAKVIRNNHFLRRNYATPAKYQRNICVCGATSDCFVDGLLRMEDHLTHYTHRGCYERYIYKECLQQRDYDREKYEVLCPFVKAYFPIFLSTPILRDLNYRKIETDHGSIILSDMPLMENLENYPDKVKLDNDWKVNNNNKLMYRLIGEYHYSLYEYTTGSYIPINNGLRRNYIPELFAFIVQHIIELLDDAEPYPEKICLYRGVDCDFAKAVLNNLRSGDIFEHKGFMSQSTRLNVAGDFSTSNIMVLCYPEKTKFLYFGRFGCNPEQHEMLTYPNQLLQFLYVKRANHFTQYYFNVIPSVVSLTDLIENKKLYITYEYGYSYLRMDKNSRKEFEEHFHIYKKEFGGHESRVLIVKKDKDKDVMEQYKLMLRTTPNLIFDMLEFVPADVTEELWLLALSIEIELLVDVLKHVRNRLAIRDIIKDELDEGYIIPFFQFPPNLITQEMRVQSDQNQIMLEKIKKYSF